MRCIKCGRPLTDEASRIRGFGPGCWKQHLDELDPQDREVRKMYGYAMCRRPNGLYVVVSPTGNAWTVDAARSSCNCPEWQYRRRCKHVDLVLRKLGEVVEPPMTAEKKREIEDDIATLF